MAVKLVDRSVFFMPIAFLLVLVLLLLLPRVKSVVMVPAAIIAFCLMRRCRLYRSCFDHRRAVAAANRRTGCATDCCTQNRAIPAAHLMADCSTGRAADRTADYCAAIDCVGVRANRNK